MPENEIYKIDFISVRKTSSQEHRIFRDESERAGATHIRHKW